MLSLPRNIWNLSARNISPSNDYMGIADYRQSPDFWEVDMRMRRIRRDKKPFGERVVAVIRIINKKMDKEYSKRMLTKITNHCLWMMWGTYLLAWFGRVEIAESLSKTIAASIIAVVIGYFAKATFENISKYTTAFGQNVEPSVPHDIEDDTDDEPNINRDC